MARFLTNVNKITGCLLCVWLAFFSAWGDSGCRAQGSNPISATPPGPGLEDACLQQAHASKLAVVVGVAGNRANTLQTGESSVQHLQNVLEDELLNRGFQLVDSSRLGAVLDDKQKELVLAGDVVSAVKLADRMGADYTVTLQVSGRVQAITAVQTTMKTVHATFSVKFIDRRKAAILGSNTVTGTTAKMDSESALLSLFDARVALIVDHVLADFCRSAPRLKTGRGGQPVAGRAEAEVPPVHSAAETEDLNADQRGDGNNGNGEKNGSSARPTKLEDL